jgi:ribosomal protein L7Ae-like RNA K-turn-binding protein
VRKLVVSPEELAAMVGSGRAVVRSVDAPFDEAMKQLWQHLNEGPEQDKAARTAS